MINASNNGTNTKQILLKTRLNNKLIYEWKLPITTTINNWKVLICQLYGFNTDEKVSIVFEGDKLNDNDTLIGCGLEDLDLIDVKIRSDLCATAISHVESNKGSSQAKATTSTNKISSSTSVLSTEPPTTLTITMNFFIKRKTIKLKVFSSHTVEYCINSCSAKTNITAENAVVSLSKDMNVTKSIHSTISQLGLCNGGVIFVKGK